MNNLAIFDVCWTLYRSNTTMDFIGHVLKNENKLFHVIFVILTCRPIAFGIVKFFKIDLRKIAIAQLAGYDRKILEDHADSFYFSFLKKRENKIVLERLLQSKKEGKKIFLASASLDIVIEAIAKNIDTSFVASELHFINGVCTGSLSYDLTGKKLLALKKETLTDFFDSMYSDNIEDLAMEKHVKDYFQIVNSRILKAPTICKLNRGG